MVLEDKTLHVYMAIRMDLMLSLELLCGASARATAERGRGSFDPRCIDLVSFLALSIRNASTKPGDAVPPVT
jgi:hypothetical protein